MPNKKYPDISFVDTNTETLVNNLIMSYEAFTGRTLYPADPARLFILWIADIIMQERIIINESAKQNVPRYAQGDYLDSLAELFKDTERLQAQPATTTLRFHISAVQPSAQVVPLGTRATINGEIIFETTETATIPPGELYADAAAKCITTEIDPVTGKEITIGAKGNGFVAGQISQIVDLFPFYEEVENITTTDGGADKETDEAFYERLRDSMEAFSTAGPFGAYVYWAKTASARITDVKPTSPEPGVVDIRILLENGEVPDDQMLQLVLDTVNADKVRPFTDYVQVSAPDIVNYNIDVTYYIPSQSESSTAIIQQNVKAALENFKKWQSEKMGRDINPSKLSEMLMSAGIKRLEIRAPAFTQIEDNAVAILKTENVIYGGVEDE
ncbi:MAG: baseplate J/gp47 family protein [Oscillospiraceae bacterium]|nr:baseplate J/gp47 family protein [Oscillospiraceae bacterium]